ncbi:MAG: phage virion morphogenesis protein [Muribaculaceae bacterium]|nr:phage virion morphogenesis protein [Muribaculaceae bacterium]
MDDQVRSVFRNILRDIQVELGDEFDQNFERQAFFSQAWARHKSPTRPGGHILVDTGGLRRSVRSELRENSVVFLSDHPAAATHNEGGEIEVTARMKRYFWHKYMSAAGVLVFCRRKDGTMRRDKNTRHITDVADFWKAMALMKVGSTIKIPQRRFLGTSPEVEDAVRQIIEENLTEYVNSIDFNIK